MRYYFLLTAALLSMTLCGCRRSSGEVWEDTKTASRHVNRGVSSLAGKHGDSRAVRSREDFMPNSYSSNPEGYAFPQGEACDDLAMADFVAPQPREIPGDPGSSIPGIDAFRDPSSDPRLAAIFRTVYFDYNSDLVKGGDVTTVQRIASYMRSNPNLYLFIAGHCDERGPEAYNLALGSRRSNAVRNMLLSDGVDPDHVFTISHGKEQPISLEHSESAWAQNRRAEFKIYQR